MRNCILALGLLAAIAAPVSAAPRVWKDNTGKHEIEAEFVSYQDGAVVLKKSDGSEISVPMRRLSSADQRFVREEIRRRRLRTNAVETTNVAAAADAKPGEWAQWRGPNRDGKSPETGLLNKWEDAPPIVWQARGLGGGYSSVAVAGSRVFTVGKRNGGEELIALSTKDGSELWATKFSTAGGDGPNSTPTVDGDLVYAVGREGDLVCCNVENGETVWSKNFGRDFGGKMMSGWGYSESPLIDGDKLICTPGGAKAILAALDKKTGRTIWTAPMPEGGRFGKDGAGYSSIVVSEAGGVRQYIQLVGRGVVSVSAKDGKGLWHYGRIANGTANVPTPIVKGDLVFCSSGYGDGGSALLRVVKRGRTLGVEEVYYHGARELQNHHGGMILIGDHVYLGHGHNQGFPTCVDLKTGRVVWGGRTNRGPGSGSAAIVYADGHLYFRYQDGVMGLIEATPEAYRLKGSFRIASKNGPSWPHPVIADGKLYLRDQHELHCYNIRKQ